MKEAFVAKDLAVAIHDTNKPVPASGQVLIRIVVRGTNQKDYKMHRWQTWDHEAPASQGDDIAGYMEGVGEGVNKFKKGD